MDASFGGSGNSYTFTNLHPGSNYSMFVSAGVCESEILSVKQGQCLGCAFLKDEQELWTSAFLTCVPEVRAFGRHTQSFGPTALFARTGGFLFCVFVVFLMIDKVWPLVLLLPEHTSERRRSDYCRKA